jgi:hypothetical protein
MPVDPTPAPPAAEPFTPLAAAPSLPPAPPAPARAEVPPPAVVTATTGTSEARPVDEAVRVREVLQRYEAAYSRLDAAAAHAIWPGVDESALARAFNGLQAQQLSLGRCDVSVTGGSAQATCLGSASWTPKVGNGRTAARRWHFDLQNASGGWRIVKAEMR